MTDEVTHILDGYARRVATYNMRQLDILGRGSDVPRRPGETDAEYRPRILAAAERGLRENLAWRASVEAGMAAEDARRGNHGLSAAEGLEDPSTVTPEPGGLGLPETPPPDPAFAEPPTLQEMMDRRISESAIDRIDRMFGPRRKL
jgi:hypothetical protein